jgi:hypothetical protein
VSYLFRSYHILWDVSRHLVSPKSSYRSPEPSTRSYVIYLYTGVSIAGLSIPVLHNRSHGDVSRFSPLGDAQMRTGASTDRCVVEDEWSLGNAASRRRVEGDVKVLPLPMLYRPERGHRFQLYAPIL